MNQTIYTLSFTATNSPIPSPFPSPPSAHSRGNHSPSLLDQSVSQKAQHPLTHPPQQQTTYYPQQQ